MDDHDHLPLLQLLQTSPSSEEDPVDDDDTEMADCLSQHSHSTPSDHSASPSETGPDGGETTFSGKPSGSSNNNNISTNSNTSPSGSSKKRKSSGTDAQGNAKPIKKRASQACEICRSRKVRCDSEKRHPCTNCADMGLICHIPESKRRR